MPLDLQGMLLVRPLPPAAAQQCACKQRSGYRNLYRQLQLVVALLLILKKFFTQIFNSLLSANRSIHLCGERGCELAVCFWSTCAQVAMCGAITESLTLPGMKLFQKS